MPSERVYLLLLHLYPASFRLEYGEDMLDAFRRVSAARRQNLLQFWLFILSDLVSSACREHLLEWKLPLTYVARCMVGSVVGTTVLFGSATVAGSMLGGPEPPITENLRIEGLQTGWLDVPSAESGKNKLVPWITFSLRNVSSHPVGFVQLNAVFRRDGEKVAWGTRYVPMVSAGEVLRSSSAVPIVVRSPLGYTGAEPVRELFHKTQFVDVRVRLFARRASSPNWQALGEWPVHHELLEP